MQAKKYLLQIRILNHRIERMQRQLEDLNAKKTTFKSPANMQTTAAGVDREEHLIDLIEKTWKYEKMITSRIDELIDMKMRIAEEINRLDDQRYCDVLTYRYVLCMQWKDVAEAMNYTENWVKELEQQALTSFAENVMSRQNW